MTVPLRPAAPPAKMDDSFASETILARCGVMDHDSTLPRSAILVVNAQSRRGQESFDAACEKLRAAGIELIETHAIHKPGTLVGIIKGAVAKRPPMIIVGGGDGSLSCAVDLLVGTDIVFAVLPLGTANSFARTMGIPLDLDGAISVIADGAARRIDLGMIGDDYFCNGAAIGLPTRIGGQIPPVLKKSLGRLGYLIWATYKAATFKPFELTVIDGDKRTTMIALEVRIANGGHYGGMELVDSADVQSGQIVVQAVPGRSTLRLGWSWMASALRLRARHATTQEFHARELRIETRPSQKISIDGEVLAKTPVTVRVAQGVIDVAAPR